VDYSVETSSLGFTDLEGNFLSVGIKDGTIILNDEGYESFSFQFIDRQGVLRVKAYTFYFDVVLTESGFVFDQND